MNDSKVALGSRVDRHEHIGKGKIGLEAFREILNHPLLAGRAFILETPIDKPGDDKRNVAALWRLTGRVVRATGEGMKPRHGKRDRGEGRRKNQGKSQVKSLTQRRRRESRRRKTWERRTAGQMAQTTVSETQGDRRVAITIRSASKRSGRRCGRSRTRFAPIDNDASRPKYYLLEMLPYPSGHAAHGPHAQLHDRRRGGALQADVRLQRAAPDRLGRFRAARGKRRDQARHASARMDQREHRADEGGVPALRLQLRLASAKSPPASRNTTGGTSGSSCACSRRGLAYRKRSRVNWCPQCQTVLANEQVIDGFCWQHDTTPVEAKEIEQWFLRITQYADALLDGIDELAGGWPERVLVMQRNWIGKSRGARVRFDVARHARAKPGSVHDAHRHDLRRLGRADLGEPSGRSRSCSTACRARGDGRRSSSRCAAKSVKAADIATAEKEGFFTGRFALNPFSGERVPIWVANFVLAEYGTGAVMAVPAHDQRDFEFAEKYHLPVKIVIQPLAGRAAAPDRMNEAYTEYGRLVDSGPYSGLTSEQAHREDGARTPKAKGFGEGETTYRLKDWGISRQRYWGTPIPVVYCEKDGIVRRARRAAAGAAAGKRDAHGARAIAAGERAGIREHDVPEMRRPGAARDRHDGHVRRFVVVFLPLHRPAQRSRAVR